MALDGIFLSSLRREIQQIALHSRIDKIYQPSKEELVIGFRLIGGTKKLLLRASSSSPRVHFTNLQLENPQSPPMFCMLLRKHLGGARLMAVRQHECDRILFLDFQTVNELGDRMMLTLAVEIMGRHSNIILIGADGMIVDSIKRVTHEMSSVRLVLPAASYTLPPAQHKLNPLTFSREDARRAFSSLKNQDFYQAIMHIYQGVSPVLAREAAHAATSGLDLQIHAVSEGQFNRLFDFFDEIQQARNSDTLRYTVVLEDGKPKDFTLVEMRQYGTYLQTKSFPTASALLDFFFVERDRLERMKQRSHDLLRLLSSASDRIVRKIAIQKQELLASMDRKKHRQMGDILTAHLHQIKKGEQAVTLPNFHEPDCPAVTIQLDRRLSPAQNAQKYYAEYRKAKNAEHKLKQLMLQSQQELIYLESVVDAIQRTTGESELLEIREELFQQGYLKHDRSKNKKMRPPAPIKYRSSDGYTILCGRNNKQNDLLTLKMSKNYDLWLHTQSIPGSHVVVLSQGEDFPARTIEQAACIAAYHSKARESTQVPVDYTLIKHVKKPNGAKPGMVIFTQHHTMYVTPHQHQIERLLATE